MTIVNDLVTSRVRKRTFRFATWFRFDTALLRVASGCKFSCDPLQRTKVRIRSIGSSRETSACWKMGSMLGALAGQEVRSQVGLRLGGREVADGVPHGPGGFVKNFSKRVAGWLTAGIGPV